MSVGLAIAAVNFIAIALMLLSNQKLAKKLSRLGLVAHHIGLAASDMWDKLTPEQIRTLHPNTVDVGNGLPKWSEIASMIERDQ